MGLATVGGGLSNSKLAQANAAVGDVVKGKTFYAGDKNLKVGTLEEKGAYTDVNDIVSAEQTVYARIPFGAYRTPTSVGKPEIRIPISNVKNALPGGDKGSWSGVYSGFDVGIPQGYHDGSGRVSVSGGNRGSWGVTIDPGGSVVIPQGYHDGNGRVSANPASAKVRTATLDASGAYSGPRTFTAAGTVICAGCQSISDGSYINVSWSGNQITVQETANSGQNRNITIVYAYYI